MELNSKGYWDARFSSGDWRSRGGEIQTMAFVNAQLPYYGLPEDFPGQIVDFGCGAGSGMVVLRDAFPQAALLGIDISETAIEHARVHYGDLAQFEAGDHTMLSDADVIICSNVLEHLDNDLSVARVLWERTTKHLCITVPYQESPLNPEHLRTYNSGHFDGVVPNCVEHVFPAKYWSEYGRRLVHLHLKNLGRRLRGRPVRPRKMQIMFRADRT
ncbi:MAG: class I SAM-dependent methyltransferase [Pseudomonadota bacterium]